MASGGWMLVAGSCLTAETFAELPAVDWLPAFTVWGMLSNNVRALLLVLAAAVEVHVTPSIVVWAFGG
jgi:hypothetical protein